MDDKAVYIKTSKGEDEMRGTAKQLYGDAKRALMLVDGKSTYSEISKRAAPSLRSILDELFAELEKGGFIQDKDKAANIPKMAVPSKLVTPKKTEIDESAEELDFTSVFRAPSAEDLAAAAAAAEAEDKAKAEAKAKAAAEAKARAAAEAKAKAEAEAKARAAAEAKAKAEAEAKARAAAEAKAKAEAEAKARAAAEAKAEAEAREREEAERRAKEEAEAARLKAEEEAAKAKAEAEAKAREEAERRAKEEAEAARLKAEEEAAKAKAEAEAKAREEAERRAKAEAEAREREEAERRAKEEAEAARLKAEEEAAKAKAEAEAKAREEAERRAKAEAEAREREEAERRAKEEAEAARLKAEEEAAKAKAEAEAKAREEAERRAKEEAEAARLKAEEEAAKAKAEAEAKAREEAERRAKEEAEAKEREEVEAAVLSAEAAQPETAGKTSSIKLEPFTIGATEDTPAPPEEHVHHVQHEDKEEKQDTDAQLMGGIELFNMQEEKTEQPVADAPVEAEPSQPKSKLEEEPVPPKELTPEPESQAPAEEPAKPVAAEPRMPSEEDVQALAGAQAKAWAEAEQRAAEAAAKAQVDLEAKKAEEARKASVKEAAAARAARKPLPWGKIGAGLFVLLLVALFAVPSVMPMQGYVTGIEQTLTAELQQPVHIGKASGRLLPTPRLELSDVSVGGSGQITVQRAQLDFAFSALFSANKQVSGIELEGLQVDGAALQQVAGWLQQVAAESQHPVAHIKLIQGKLEAEGIQFSGIDGELDFDAAGKFTKARLTSDGGKISVDIDAIPGNKFQTAISVRGSALPLLPNWTFDDLNAKGELSADGLLITDIDSRAFGGVLLGDARLDWRSGWSAQGTLVGKAISLQNVSPLLTGDMDGKAKFRMQADSLSKLADSVVTEGTFVVSKGIITGIDIVETTRLHSKSTLPGGRTHFDELSGELNYANDAYSFGQLRMKAGVLNATGALDISRRQLSGKMFAELSLRGGMGTVPLQIGGTIDGPTLVATR
ncbi:MAG: AsmA family protein [Nitrosomonadales bacterium]|nr:AsmA family protein [Nitrosomonadales bacterium]